MMLKTKIILFFALPAVLLIGFLAMPKNNELVRTVYGPNFDCRKVLSRPEFIRINAEAGHAKSQDTLANYYFHGYEEDKKIDANRAEAIKWYRLAAEQGNMDAQAHLGILYASDLGIVAPNTYETGFARKFKAPPDYAEAAKWFALAAAQGDINSQYYLSYQFRDGLGVRQDDIEAYFWIAQVQRRDRQYHKERDKFLDRLTSQQLDSIRQRILDWKPTVTPSKQKDLLDLPWELCASSPKDCRVSTDGNTVSFHCLRNSGDPHYIISKKTNEIESAQSAQY